MTSTTQAQHVQVERLQLGGRDVALAVCSVSAARDELLLPEERALLTARATAKRRQEFGAGRLAAVHALQGLGWPRLPVLARAEGTADAGRPYVEGAPELAVSISHAGGLAVALVSAAGVPVGVDVEEDTERSDAFLEEAFAPGELGGFEGLPLPAVATAWATKEAVLKVWGVGLRAPLGQVHVVPELQGPLAGGLSALLQVHTGELPEGLGPPPRILAALFLPLRPNLVATLALPSPGG